MTTNPPLSAFVAAFKNEMVFGQLRIWRMERGFELRHLADQECDAASLRLLAENEIRPLVQFTAAGEFRPLKSAPNLQRGWRVTVRDAESLGAVVNQIYPGAVADWFAAQSPTPPITSYRDFTGRQTGMYRITTHLDDATAGAVARACCHSDFCLKRRLWTVPGLAPDSAAGKSAIPCLEPCAILLEFARKMARVTQEEKAQPASTVADRARQREEATAGLRQPDTTIAESDFDSPRNPRRLRFVLERDPGGD